MSAEELWEALALTLKSCTGASTSREPWGMPVEVSEFWTSTVLVWIGLSQREHTLHATRAVNVALPAQEKGVQSEQMERKLRAAAVTQAYLRPCPSSP